MSSHDRVAALLREVDGTNQNIRKVPVIGVDGCFILENVFRKEDCDVICDAVRAITEKDPKYLASLKHSGEKSEVTDVDTRRRTSQHHTPCHVDQGVLSNLLKQHLPHQAGPSNTAELDKYAISNFLRCYDYRAGDASMPHFDRSFSEHEIDSAEDCAQTQRKGGRLIRFSAYSLVIYLNDEFEGGCTTFFPEESARQVVRSRRGNTSAEDIPLGSLRVSVTPKQGSVLIFPHGRNSGCYTDPLHEGSVVTSGRKTIIRTDVFYRPVAKKSRRRKRSKCGDSIVVDDVVS